MGNYTPLADLGARMKARRNREHRASGQDVARSAAPWACPSCYDTSVVPVECPACQQRMVRFDAAIVLPSEPKKLSWFGWPLAGGVACMLVVFGPWALANAGVDARSDIYSAIPSAMNTMVIIAMGVFLMLAARGWLLETAPRRRARAQTKRMRDLDVQTTRELSADRRARVRGVARVRVEDGNRALYVEDEVGQVRVAVDPTLNVLGPRGPLRAVADGDEVEVCGALDEELGEPSAYRERRAAHVFRAGATVLVGV